MKNHGLAYLLLTSIALLVLMISGCEKDHDTFLSDPLPPSGDPLPTNVIGTWIAQSAMVDGQTWDLGSVFRDRYHPSAAAARLQFTWDGQFSYALIDTGDTEIWLLQGPAVLHGQHLTCTVTNCSGYPQATGFNIIDDTWSLNADQLVLPHSVDDNEDHLASVTFKKQ